MVKDVLIYEIKDQITYITIDNPENNRLDPPLCRALGAAWARFANDKESRVAILSAKGPDFSRGADIYVEGLLNDLLKAFPPNGTKILKPIVGAVHGNVIGSGYGLGVIGTDITYATEDTKFIFGEVYVGIVGAVVDYRPYMPFKASMEFYMSGKPLGAQRAYELGLINGVTKNKEELMKEAIKMAEILRDNAPLSLRAIKYGHYKIMENEGRRAMRLAREEFEAFIQPQLISEDFKEGKAALKEKRKPIFKGR